MVEQSGLCEPGWKPRRSLFHSSLFSVAAGAPSQPLIDEITKDSATLSWKKPSNDGGSKLTGYVVEKKKKGEDWTECAQVPANETTAKVPNLKVGGMFLAKTPSFSVFLLAKKV